MNYKVIDSKFITIKQENGLIENNTLGTLEIAVTDITPVKNNESNILIEPNGKFYFTKDGSKKVYVRLTNRISGIINVFETKGNEGGDSELDNYYNKTESDERYVQKDGSKVLSDNNYTNEDKEKLNKFQYATENPKANGEANVGASEKLAREDHIHPKQTDITGNAGTADKLKTARVIKLTGAVTGQTNFDGSAEASISVTLGDLEGSSVKKLTGYTKGANSNAIAPTDSLLVALGKLEKGVEEAKAQPASISYNQKLSRDFKICYCTETEYNSKEKVQDDSVIYMILDEKTGTVILKCYRP